MDDFFYNQHLQSIVTSSEDIPLSETYLNENI
jgi:hypothetical protein